MVLLLDLASAVGTVAGYCLVIGGLVLEHDLFAPFVGGGYIRLFNDIFGDRHKIDLVIFLHLLYGCID